MGELVSGVLLRPRITFHASGPSAFDIELCKRSFQLLALASLIATFTSWQASIHSCRFWCIVWRRRLELWIFAWTCGLIQGIGFLLGLVLPTWSEAEDLRMLLNSEIRMEMLGSSGSCCLRDSTSLVKEDQSPPLQRHLVFLGMTGWYLILWLITMESDHDVLVDQLQPQRDKLGVLSFLVIRLVQVAKPSFKMCRSLLMIQSMILLPQALGGWTWSQRCEWPLKSSMIMESGDGLIRFGSKWVCWVLVLGMYMLYISIHNDCDVWTRMDKISIPAFLRDCSFSKITSLWTKNRRPPPKMLFWSLRMVA